MCSACTTQKRAGINYHSCRVVNGHQEGDVTGHTGAGSVADEDMTVPNCLGQMVAFMKFSGAEAKVARRLLMQFEGNIERAVNCFFDNVATTTSTSAKAPTSASINSFVAATGAEHNEARACLIESHNDIEMAVSRFFDADDMIGMSARSVIADTAATLGLQMVEVKGPPGHCFWSAFAQQLACQQIFYTFAQLRGFAADEMLEEHHNGSESVAYGMYMKSRNNTQSFQAWCRTNADDMRYAGAKPTWADHLAITCLLAALRRKGLWVLLRIIASRQATGTSQAVLEMERLDVPCPGGSDKTRLILTVGHIWRRHYMGSVLSRLDSLTRSQETSAQTPSTTSKTANSRGSDRHQINSKRILEQDNMLKRRKQNEEKANATIKDDKTGKETGQKHDVRRRQGTPADSESLGRRLEVFWEGE